MQGLLFQPVWNYNRSRFDYPLAQSRIGGMWIHMRLVIGIWFIIINLIGYFVMSEDKRKARRRQERTPERTLFLLALIGGALGVLIAMYRWRHKTKHLSFVVGIPVLLFINAVLYVYFLR